ncbi:MAG: N-acetylglucosamine kinase [Anaerolineae bacterium]
MRYVLGVDGGGSKVICLLADERGQLRGYGRAGPVDINYVERSLAVDALRRAMQAALEAGGLLGAPIEVLCISAPMDSVAIDEALGALVVRRILEAAKGETARWAAHYWVEQHVGVIVDAGVGSIARGWTKEGQHAGAGGWGALLGDEGGGYWIGIQAMRAVLQAHDGRGEDTLLTQMIFDHFGFRNALDMVFRVSCGMIAVQDAAHLVGIGSDAGMEAARTSTVVRKARSRDPLLPRHEIASLCPLVVRAAQQGDYAAQHILTSAGRALGELAVAVIQRLYMTPESFAVVPFGGVFKAGDLILSPFRETILATAPQAQIVLPRFEPVVGAVLLALDDIGVTIDWPVLESLEQGAVRFPSCRA